MPFSLNGGGGSWMKMLVLFGKKIHFTGTTQRSYAWSTEQLSRTEFTRSSIWRHDISVLGAKFIDRLWFNKVVKKQLGRGDFRRF